MKKRNYSLATERLIYRTCRNVERKDFVLDEKLGAEMVLKTYDLFDLPRPKKIVWCIDIFDKRFVNVLDSARSAGSARSARSAESAWSAWSAGSARSARSAWSAGSAESAWSARSAESARSAWSAESAWSAWSAWSARSARSALDYDFDWFVIEHEYSKNRKDNPGDEPNENDKKYLQYSELLMKAIECGVGFRAEYNDTLYLVPDRLCRIDDKNRFHSLEGPAIWWKGGHKFYYVHGINIPEKIILNPNKLTKKDWLGEKNAEARRIIQDRMPDFVKRVGAKRIQKDKRGELMEIELPGDPEKIARYVKVKDSSTPRVYYLRVPPTTETCRAGVAWSFGLEEKDYLPEQET